MSCCCPHSRSASRLFSWFSGSHCRRFKRSGFEASQKQLLKGLQQAGFDNSSLLEIGCGVGHLHQSLLEQGASRALGIDLAPGMIERAEQWASERDLANRTEYQVGDFIDLSPQLQPMDITLLDKVVCCYPDADALVHQALDKTGRVIALTYPRKRWYVLIGEKLGKALMWLLRSDFRAYVHDPEQVEAWITGQGFEKKYQDTTWAWLTQVYVRREQAD